MQPATTPSKSTSLKRQLTSLSRKNCRGLVVELGVFRGGTLLLMNQMLKALGFKGAHLIGFDTFDGFPPPRCLLDMFAMDKFVNRDFAGTSRLLEAEGIRLVRGDIVETAKLLQQEPLLLTFIDTDNYSPAAAALPVCWKGTVKGGAVIMDHFYTKASFCRHHRRENRCLGVLQESARCSAPFWDGRVYQGVIRVTIWRGTIPTKANQWQKLRRPTTAPPTHFHSPACAWPNAFSSSPNCRSPSAPTSLTRGSFACSPNRNAARKARVREFCSLVEALAKKLSPRDCASLRALGNQLLAKAARCKAPSL